MLLQAGNIMKGCTEPFSLIRPHRCPGKGKAGDKAGKKSESVQARQMKGKRRACCPPGGEHGSLTSGGDGCAGWWSCFFCVCRREGGGEATNLRGERGRQGAAGRLAVTLGGACLAGW